jgi:hypothetical protein
VDAQPAWSDLPVLVMTKRGADSLEAQRAVEHLGNVTCWSGRCAPSR